MPDPQPQRPQAVRARRRPPPHPRQLAHVHPREAQRVAERVRAHVLPGRGAQRGVAIESWPARRDGAHHVLAPQFAGAQPAQLGRGAHRLRLQRGLRARERAVARQERPQEERRASARRHRHERPAPGRRIDRPGHDRERRRGEQAQAAVAEGPRASGAWRASLSERVRRRDDRHRDEQVRAGQHGGAQQQPRERGPPDRRREQRRGQQQGPERLRQQVAGDGDQWWIGRHRRGRHDRCPSPAEHEREREDDRDQRRPDRPLRPVGGFHPGAHAR